MNNVAVINADVETRLRLSAKELIDKADEVIIFTRNDLSLATDICSEIKKRIKVIEDEREKIVKPINEGVKQVNNNFKTIRIPLEEAETRLKSSMLKFQQDEQRKADEERKKLEAEQRIRDEEIRVAETEAQKVFGHNNPPEPIGKSSAPAIQSSFKPSTYGQTGATSTLKKVWKFELTDIAALAAARPDLVTVNQVAINQEIRGQGGVIAGLRIYQDDVLQVR